MTNFVRDNTAIPSKTDWDNDPAKTIITNPEMYDAASNYLIVRQAAYDLRAWIQTGLTVGSYANATLTVDADGRITGVAAGSAGVPTSRTVNGTSPIRINGAASATLAADVTISLLASGVTPGAYTIANFTVDAFGRLTAATSTTLAAIATSGNGVDLADGSVSAAKLANTAVAPASYTNTSLTVDAQGRITTASSGAAGVPTSRTLTTTSPLRIDGGASADLSANRTLAIATNGIDYTLEAQAPANTMVGNNTNGTANKADLTLAQILAFLGIKLGAYGTGNDGAAVMNGSSAVTGCSLSGTTYTALRSLSFSSMVFSGGATFKPDGYEQFCSGAVTGTGTIDSSGGSGVTTTAGAQSWTTTRQLPAGGAGLTGGAGTGTNGVASTAAPTDFDSTAAAGGTSSSGVSHAGTNGGQGHGGGGGGSGGTGGGAGASGGNGGAITIKAEINGDSRCRPYAFNARGNDAVAFSGSTAGGSGGGAGGGGGPGGASGAGGGWMVLHYFSIASTITIKVNGGNGGNGTAGSGAGGGGGGAGGGGGYLVLDTTTASGSMTTNVTGGTGGSGGAGDTGFFGGAAGGNGGSGTLLVFN